jgi:NADH:ubiquinone oxidoreductase subunit H
MIPLVFIALFTPDSALFRILSKGMIVQGIVDIEWTLLVIAILNSFNCTMSAFAGWSMFVHYCYIRGCRETAEKEVSCSVNSSLKI